MPTKSSAGKTYKCNVCDDRFEHYALVRYHEQRCGVAKLTEFTDEPLNNIQLINNTPSTDGKKSIQTKLIFTGDSHMEQQPELDPDQVVDRPTNETLEGKVTDWNEGTRKEVFNMDDDETPKYGELEDRMISIEGVVEKDGEEFNFNEVYRRRETISDQQDLGKFLKRYGQPKEAMTVDVSFDGDSQASIVIE